MRRFKLLSGSRNGSEWRLWLGLLGVGVFIKFGNEGGKLRKSGSACRLILTSPYTICFSLRIAHSSILYTPIH
jgi:hypothetical protein